MGGTGAAAVAAAGALYFTQQQQSPPTPAPTPALALLAAGVGLQQHLEMQPERPFTLAVQLYDDLGQPWTAGEGHAERGSGRHRAISQGTGRRGIGLWTGRYVPWRGVSRAWLAGLWPDLDLCLSACCRAFMLTHAPLLPVAPPCTYPCTRPCRLAAHACGSGGTPRAARPGQRLRALPAVIGSTRRCRQQRNAADPSRSAGGRVRGCSRGRYGGCSRSRRGRRERHRRRPGRAAAAAVV
mgnify:CR=1 FL=1